MSKIKVTISLTKEDYPELFKMKETKIIESLNEIFMNGYNIKFPKETDIKEKLNKKRSVKKYRPLLESFSGYSECFDYFFPILPCSVLRNKWYHHSKFRRRWRILKWYLASRQSQNNPSSPL